MEPAEVIELLQKNGSRGVFIPFHHVDEVKEEIRNLFGDGKLDAEFYNEYLQKYIEAKLPRSMRSPKSVLLVATAALQRKVTFHYRGQLHEMVVPPTYGTYPQVARGLKKVLMGGRKSMSFRLVPAFPPVKLLAVKSGFAMYGRNNITYVPGFGSFHRLTAFYTDLEVPEGTWGEKRMLLNCTKCRACLSKCPTGAISEERVLLKAERCLSYLNEKSNEQEFPSWVKPEFHNAIVGCMTCQRACPLDRGFLDKFEMEESFSEEETEYLLGGRYSGSEAASLRRRLKRAGLDMSILPRNLEVMLNAGDPRRRT